MTPGRQAVIILWEATTQYRGADGVLKSVPLDGENIEKELISQLKKVFSLLHQLIPHLMNLEDILLMKFPKFLIGFEETLTLLELEL